jgi:hypothetical protein
MAEIETLPIYATNNTDATNATNATVSNTGNKSENLQTIYKKSNSYKSKGKDETKTSIISQLLQELQKIEEIKNDTQEQENQLRQDANSGQTNTQPYNAITNSQASNSAYTTPELQPIKNLVEGLTSEKKELKIEGIKMTKLLTLNMRKPILDTAIPHKVYKELVTRLTPYQLVNVDDKSQRFEELIKYDIFYTLNGTIEKRNGTGELNNTISIKEISGPFVQCQQIDMSNSIFTYNGEKTYIDLSNNLDILKIPLKNEAIDYSNKKFQLCIKINNSETDIEKSSLMNMTIFNESI